MAEDNKENKIQIQSEVGMVKNLSLQARLILRLLGDKRVSFFAKLLPLASLVYFISPDLLPFILDDAAVIGVGSYMFMELCPPAIVEEHRQALWGEQANSNTASSEDILDAEFKE